VIMAQGFDAVGGAAIRRSWDEAAGFPATGGVCGRRSRSEAEANVRRGLVEPMTTNL